MVENTFLPYPLPKNYAVLQKQWLSAHPWVTIGKLVTFPLETKVLGTPLEIKSGTIINGPMVVKGSGFVSIGKYCAIAENLYIISSNHRIDRPDIQGNFTVPSDINKGPVYIGNNVWIGDNVMILPGVTIGDGAAIGAGSIVTKNIPPFVVAVGAPARVIKYRFSDKIRKELLKIGWWHWNHSAIRKNIYFFAQIPQEKTFFSSLTSLKLKDNSELTKIDLKRKDSMNYLLDGWGTHEKEGRWVEKSTCGLIFKVHEIESYTHLSFFGYSFHSPQRVSFVLNERKIAKLSLSSSWQKYRIPLSGLKKQVNILRILFEKGFSPSTIDKNSTDFRTLFCRFAYFQLTNARNLSQ